MATKTARRGRARSKSNWHSRAVLRPIEAGSDTYCTVCGERVKFQAKLKMQQVICNVYVKGNWDRVEHFHAGCYDTAGHPYGHAAA